MKAPAQRTGTLRFVNMKTILAIITCALVAFTQSACTMRPDVSGGHEGHSHGVAVKECTERGVSGSVRTY